MNRRSAGKAQKRRICILGRAVGAASSEKPTGHAVRVTHARGHVPRGHVDTTFVHS